jgi:hypothetical protein
MRGVRMTYLVLFPHALKIKTGCQSTDHHHYVYGCSHLLLLKK